MLWFEFALRHLGGDFAPTKRVVDQTGVEQMLQPAQARETRVGELIVCQSRSFKGRAELLRAFPSIPQESKIRESSLELGKSAL